MNKQGQILIEVNKSVEDLGLFHKIVKELHKLNYSIDVKGMNNNNNPFFFFQINKDKKIGFCFGSLDTPASLSNKSQGPIEMKQAYKLFDAIIDPTTSKEYLIKLQKDSYKNHNNKL